ncbi:MAG TPA: aminotransferase class I/II-fold pyridoxal phosphate-dependent enzyme [Gaiellaceae bacterium]|nr:aminotransferase class I/II-fold pyridoxal phosphate-dependent enzyme [Gaiellaceae bacterium]
MQLSPILAELAQYPFTRLDDWRAEARRNGIEPIDFGVGDPREVTPAFIRKALVAGIDERSSYPRAVGLPELREVIAAWLAGRYGVSVDPAVELLPTLGSKEAIFSFAQVAVGQRRLIAVPEPGYPVYERGALFAGAEVVTVPLREGSGWLPDLDAFDRWDELAVFWVCYPNNPTGATAPLSFYEELAARAREHGFLVCSDEAYSELWFGEEPVSALQVADRSNLVVFNTLSKRSSMTGYRSGFVCAPKPIADALRAFRPSLGQRHRSSSSVHRSRRGRTSSTCSTCARSTAASARRCCRCWPRKACALRVETRRSSSGSRSTAHPRRLPAACSSTGSCSRRAPSSARQARAM